MKNNKTRRILFTLAFAAIIVAICVVCFIIGRGHTVYLDNKTTEDEKYHYYDAIDIYQDGEKLTTLNARERTSITQIGQNFEVELHYRKGKNEEKKEMVAYFKLPYNLDGIVINLPAMLDGADESVYMSEFVSMAIVVEGERDDEVPVTDEFGLEVVDE